MAVTYLRAFTTTCPGALIDAVNDDVSITPVLEQITNEGGAGNSTFYFTSALSGPEETAFDAILSTWTCDPIPETYTSFDEFADDVRGFGIYAYAKTQGNGTPVSSNGLLVTRTGVGVYQYEFTQPYGSADYAVVGNPILTVTDTNLQVSNETSTGFTVTVGQGDNGTTSDVPVDELHTVVVFGVDGPTGLGSAYQSWLAVGNVGTEEDFLDDLRPPPADLAVVQARRSTIAADIPLAWIDVNFDVTDVENDPAVIEHDDVLRDRILIKETGLYEVWYSWTVDDEAQGRVRVNDNVVLPGSEREAGEIFDANDVIVSMSVKTIAQLTAGDFLTVQIQSRTTAEILFENATFIVTKLEGTQGPAGPPGAGSSVVLEDEGALVPGGPHGILNFVGDGVNVVDAGGGRATVNVPGFEGKEIFYHHNGTTTQTLSGSFATALFNSAVRTDGGAFSYASGEVTVTQTGWYEVTYNIGADSDNGDRSTLEAVLQQNAVDVPGTFAYSYHRTSAAGENTASCTAIVNITANDVMRVRIRIRDGSGIVTLSNACRLMIRRVDGP
jgi:hypothetical protein